MKSLVLFLFFILLIGAIVFARERILFCDASYMTAEILNAGSLHSDEFRFGCFITQAVPLLCSKAGLPLSAIVLCYSISFNLLYLVVAALLLFRFNNKALAILMAFYYTLFVSDTYFWTNNEVHQGIAFMFLFFAVVLHFKKRRYSWWLHIPLFTLLAFIALFTHPLVLFVLPYLWLFYILDPELKPYKRRETIMLSSILLIICITKYCLMTMTSYDGSKMRNATHFSIKDIVEGLQSPMTKVFLASLLTRYYFVPVLLLSGLYIAAREQRRKPLGLTCFFLLAYFFAMSLTHKQFNTFYIESQWMPFSILATTLFVYYVLPRLKPSMVVGLLAFIFAVRVGYIAFSAQRFVTRKEWLYTQLNAMRSQGITKGYIYKNASTDKLLMIDWGVPAESMIASAISGDMPVRTFVVDDAAGIEKRKVSAREMIGCFDAWPYSHLNNRYFNIDTTSAYVEIK